MNSGRNQFKRYALSAVSAAILVVLTGCGGGGGGGGGGYLVPSIPGTTPGGTGPGPGTDPGTIPGGGGVVDPIVPVEPVIVPPQEPAANTARAQLLSADPRGTQGAYAQGLSGAGVRIGVIDSDFDTANAEFSGRVIKTAVNPGTFPNGNGNAHGTLVAEVLAGATQGTARQSLIEGFAAGVNGEQVQYSSQAYADLYNKGVRIINQSNGGGSVGQSGDSAFANSIASQTQPFVTNGGLLIWSAGNGAEANPTIPAAAPYYNPGLEKGWLAVVAVNSSVAFNAGTNYVGQVGDLASYSNACGVAANWCLAAPGDYFSKIDNTYHFGTSFAAPVVTGAAALVSEKFPWMSGDNIRQTILSTATDMGDRSKFGWGLLNTSKAVNGPGLFDKRLTGGADFSANLGSYDATFSNDIGGDAGLIKTGTGTLTLSGNNTYTGGTLVGSGSLNLTGSVAGDMSLGGSATLLGTGAIGGQLANVGRVYNSGTGFKVKGDFQQAPIGTLVYEFGSAPLTVGGVATLNGSNLHASTPSGTANGAAYGYIDGQAGITQTVLTAQGGVTGTFGTFQFENNGAVYNPGPLLSGNVSYTANDVKLDVIRNNPVVVLNNQGVTDPTQVASAKNLESALKVVDKIATSNNETVVLNNQGVLEDAAAILATQNGGQLSTVLDSLSGQVHASAQILNFQQAQALNHDLSNRMVNVKDAPETAGVWVNGIVARGNIRQSGFAGADTSTNGFQAGYDRAVGTQGIVGVAVSHANSDARFDRNAGTSESETTMLSAYGLYNLNANSYLLGRVGFGRADTDTQRTIWLGSLANNARASHKDNLFSAYGEYGYKMRPSEDTSITPFVGLAYDRVKRGAFSEVGSNFGLTAGSDNFSSTSAVLGLRSDTKVNWFGSNTTNLKFYTSVNQILGDNSLDFNANFNGIAAAPVRVEGARLSKTSGWVGVGITTTMSNKWSWYANLDAQVGRGGVLNKMISAGVRVPLN